MGHITADDAKWLVSIAIFAVLVWSVAFLVYVQPGNPRGARQRKADRRAASNFKAGPFIFNLGHGVLPDTPLAHVEQLVARVRASA
jgi:hypothetical protein